jgi:hypothetical protein
MRTTIDVDTDLLRRLRAQAHRQGVSLKEALNGALRRGLDQPESRAEPYTCPTFDLGTPLRPLDRALALVDALEDEEVARELALRK